MFRVLLTSLCFACTLACCADAPKAWPLWDGQESIEQYAKRVKLPATKTLDLGNGMTLELVLIPAGKFVMGTPEPKPVDTVAFGRNIALALGLVALGGFSLLGLVYAIVGRARFYKRPVQYTLAQLLAGVLAMGVMLGGAMHWWRTEREHAAARKEHAAAAARYSRAYDEEKPGHLVTLTRPFYIGRYEATQEQYQQVAGANPSNFKGANLPVEEVSWTDAARFCKRVSDTTHEIVRLPTEAEWEYACRAGTTTTYWTGDADADLGRAAWYYGADKMTTTHLVGQKAPNAWGVFDVHGNVWEWCSDWYSRYDSANAVEPQGPDEGKLRVLRGGSWRVKDARECTSTRRARTHVEVTNVEIGFRVVVDVPTTP